MPQQEVPDIQPAISAYNQKNFSETERLCRRYLRDGPDDAAAWQLLGLSLAAQDRAAESLEALEKARLLAPRDASVPQDMAAIMAGQGRADQALALLADAHRMAPDSAVILTNMGCLLQSRGEWPAAMEIYRRAIALDPDDAVAHGNLGGCLLGLEHWHDGFAEYEWRLKQAQVRHSASPAPLWRGQPLAGKRLLVTAEQGYGDMIQFARFLPPLIASQAARGAEIIVECQSGLEPLLTPLLADRAGKTAGRIVALDVHQPPPAADFQVSMISLGHRLGFGAAAAIPYIKGENRDERRPDAFRVGIVWTGRPVDGTAFQRHEHHLRHLPIARLGPLSEIPGIELVGLQQSWATPELEASGLPIADTGYRLTDFQATADIIAGLDLVIAIDTAVAHLAGAMGKPLWLLLGPGHGDYRWGAPGAGKSPWYPQARLFRAENGDWRETIRFVARTLRFERAVTAQRAGDPALASLLYRQLLSEDPQHPLALCNLGQLQAEHGENAEAEASYRAAIQARPTFPEAWNNLGALLQDLHRYEEADAAFRRALDFRPGFAAAWSNLGNVLRLTARPAEAETAYRRAISLDAGYFQAYCGLGNALKELLRFPEADRAYAEALALRPDHAESLINRAGVLLILGRLEESVRATMAALAVRPNFPEAEGVIRLVLVELGVALLERNMLDEAEQICLLAILRYPADPECRFRLGNVFLRRRDLDRAEKEYLHCLDIKEDYAPAHNNLCSIYLERDQSAKALERARRAAAIDGRLPDVHNNMGNALRACGKPEEAMAAYAQAIALRAHFPEAFNNLAVLMGELGLSEGALAAFAQATALRPDYAEAYSNMGNVYKGLRRGDEAIAAYGKALEIRPDYHGARLNLAIALLQQGRWAEGWEQYYARWLTGPLARQRVNFSQPEWSGEPLEGKTILLYGEQGYGDVLQFVRYAPLLAERGARVIALVHKGLVRLFRSALGVAEVRPFDDPPADFDYHLAMMSAPRVFATTPDNIPAPVPYLAADPAEVAQWRQRLAHLPGRKVGLVWSGDPRPHDLAAHMLDKQRSIPLQSFEFMKDIPGISLISLQKGAPSRQVAGSGLPLFDAMDEISDFAGTAALVSALDLVVSVDTSMVHLTGAIGVPVWILSRFDGCWRWLLDREDSGWYPSARLFLQTAPNDWKAALARLEASLRTFAQD